MATVSEYLTGSLLGSGIGHVFGIQGDYVLGFYRELCESPLEVINTCDEQSAGFAADAYARVSGFGAVCVTYGVGGLKLANTTAQAYAESSPVLVISGAPGVSEREFDPLLHHKVRSFDTQLNVFREMTCAQAVLNDAGTAADDIDRVIATVMETRRPGYIELPRDMLRVEAASPMTPGVEEPSRENSESLDEAVGRALEMLSSARRPVAVVGLEVHRFGLQQLMLEFLERSGLPFVTGVLGKSAISESHPQFMGVYAGALSPEEVRETVEGSDCVILVGPLTTDLATGIFTHNLDTRKGFVVFSGGVMFEGLGFADVRIRQFLEALTAALPGTRPGAAGEAGPRRPVLEPFAGEDGRPVTVDRLFSCINGFLEEDTDVIAEAGDSLFGALDLVLHGNAQFISPAYYASLGFGVPASIGVQFADRARRPLVLTGDGSFQMTGMELSVSLKHGLSPIVVILNNSGYGTFRPMADGPFNDVPAWRYAEIVRVIGGGEGYTVSTEDELSRALAAARLNDASPTIIDVRLGKHDTSERLRILTRELKKRTG